MSDMWHFYYEKMNDIIYKIYDIDPDQKEYIEKMLKSSNQRSG